MIIKEKVTKAADVNKLPEGMISRILKCLPLRDAAKMSVLSTNLMNGWKELPALKFDAAFFSQVLNTKILTVPEFFHVLSKILLSHVGHIDEFYLYIPVLLSSGTLDLGPCISFLARNKIKEMTITNASKSRHKLSHHLFSCVSLENLKLHNCSINFLPTFRVFRNLMSIELEEVDFMGNSFTEFIVSCPVLQSLSLKNIIGFNCVYIKAPNLKYFTLCGKFESIHLKCVENLVAVSISLEELNPNHLSIWSCELLSYLAHPCKIEKLSFGGSFCKCLVAGSSIGMFPTCYRYLNALHLSNIESDDLDEFLWVLGILQSCPTLEELDISFLSENAADHKLVFHRRTYPLTRLRKVKVTSVLGFNMELKLIELLLFCATALETMHLKSHENITPVLKAKLTRELIYFRRASPKAVVIYE